jgi:hypothetical protein
MLQDDQDTRRLLSKLLYLMSSKPKRRKLPSALDPQVKRFVAGQSFATIGQNEYTFQELLSIAIDEPEY